MQATTSLAKKKGERLPKGRKIEKVTNGRGWKSHFNFSFSTTGLHTVRTVLEAAASILFERFECGL